MCKRYFVRNSSAAAAVADGTNVIRLLVCRVFFGNFPTNCTADTSLSGKNTREPKKTKLFPCMKAISFRI